MADDKALTPGLTQVILDDLERDGLIVRTGEYRLGAHGLEPVYVAIEHSDEALRRQQHKRH